MDGSSYRTIAPHAEAPAGPADVRLETAMPMLPRTGTSFLRRLVHPSCVALAAAAHVGLAALMLAGTADEFGESGSALEAIAVDVIETLPTTSSPAVSASAGNFTDTVEEAREEPASEASPAEPPPNPVAAPTENLILLSEIARTVPPPLPPQPPEPPIERAPDPAPPAPATPPVAARMESIAIGEASAGTVNAYGAELSRIISRGRPRGREAGNLKGTVVVEFVVGFSGALDRADVKKSSGSPQLDNLGLAALRRLSFPTPAAEMTLKQRTFTVPFVYR